MHNMFASLSIVVGFVTTLPVLLVQAGQIPVIEGVVGGVPTSQSTHNSIGHLVESFAQTPLFPESRYDTAYHQTQDYSKARKEKPSPGKLRIKSENSGICEETEGVYQATGYGDLSPMESIWYVLIPSFSDLYTLAHLILPRGSGSSRRVTTPIVRLSPYG